MGVMMATGGPATMKAPFPWFGGKSRVSAMVWEYFGNVTNYVEPFFGSGAVLLGRPSSHVRDGRWPLETVNDFDCYLANFWRAITKDPGGVAGFADWPVNEADLEARHLWLIQQADFKERMKGDPDFYDIKIAGWWVWGLSAWIGGGWCSEFTRQRPHLGDAGTGMGINRQLPHLGNAGMGINRQRPHLGDAGTPLQSYFSELSNRLRKVRVCCGDWARVMGPSVTFKHGLTGVFLDPPYNVKRNMSYAVDESGISNSVREWAIANGDNPLLRIAICGYSGEHVMPENWTEIPWKTQGGYGLMTDDGLGRENSTKERIWFSPHCSAPKQLRISFNREAGLCGGTIRRT